MLEWLLLGTGLLSIESSRAEDHSTAFLRTIYSATSARRQKAEGYLVDQHWQARAIRGIKE